MSSQERHIIYPETMFPCEYLACIRGMSASCIHILGTTQATIYGSASSFDSNKVGLHYLTSCHPETKAVEDSVVLDAYHSMLPLLNHAYDAPNECSRLFYLMSPVYAGDSTWSVACRPLESALSVRTRKVHWASFRSARYDVFGGCT